MSLKLSARRCHGAQYGVLILFARNGYRKGQFDLGSFQGEFNERWYIVLKHKSPNDDERFGGTFSFARKRKACVYRSHYENVLVTSVSRIYFEREFTRNIYITQSFGKIGWSRSIILKAYYANGTIIAKVLCI
jgi:hypothetical protein